MKFIRKGQYFEVSECDRFIVAAYCVCEEWKFAATDRARKELLGICASGSEARALCEQRGCNE